MDLTQENKALMQAKIHFMDRPDCEFLAHLVVGIQHIFDLNIPTAQTDGVCVKYSPQYFMRYEAEYRVGLIAHELGHIMLDHCGRMTDLANWDMHRLNIAGDIVIDTWLESSGFKVPDSLAKPEWAKFSTEQIYTLLDTNPQPPKSDEMASDILPFGSLSAGGGSASPLSAAQQQLIRFELDDLLIQAMQATQRAGKGIGDLPGEIQLYLQELTKPKVRWDALLQVYATAVIKRDWSYALPNRRFYPKVFMPVQRGRGIEHLAFSCDISGSVSDKEFAHDIVEARHALERCNPKKLSLIQFDATIQHVDVLRTPADLMNLTFSGRGGTRIDPVMQWAADNKPNVMVVCSDGYFTPPTVNPRCPVIWLIVNNPEFTKPFGKVIHLEI
jgi:predicted metal-dependent peptidase